MRGRPLRVDWSSARMFLPLMVRSLVVSPFALSGRCETAADLRVNRWWSVDVISALWVENR
jgi:hypothetical protein